MNIHKNRKTIFSIIGAVVLITVIVLAVVISKSNLKRKADETNINTAED